MKGIPKKLGILLTFIILFTTIFNGGIIASFGAENIPLINVETYGTASKGDPMFSGGLWAPGTKQSGVLRITNNHSQRIRVNNLALVMKLEKLENGEYKPVENQQIIEKYAKSMKLTVTRGRFLIFNETLYNNSFYEMLYEKGNHNRQGYQLSSSKQFNIGRNDSIDLKYTVEMDPKKAGNELQGLRATVDFIVNLHENPTSPGSGGGGGGARDNERDERILEVPDEPVPLGDPHWAHDCVVKLMEEGIVRGYPDGSLRLDNPITRAETAVIIAKALELDKKDKLFSGYMDTLPKWARGYIIATTDASIFQGYPVAIVGRVFRPDQYITREEMATVLMKGFGLKPQENQELKFTDKEDIADWSLEYVKAGVENRIIVGYPDHTFKPQNNITRGEAFVMICKLLGYHTEH